MVQEILLGYVKGVITEVVPPVAEVPVSTIGDTLDDSLGSWSSLEMEKDAPAHPPPPPTSGGVESQKLLKSKIQAGVQGRQRFLEGEMK